MRPKAILFIVAACLLAGAYYLYGYKPSSPAVGGEGTFTTIARYDAGDKAAFYASGGKAGLFLAERDGIRFLTPAGSEAMNRQYSAQNPLVAGSGAVCAVLEKNGAVVRVFSQATELYTVTAAYPIVSFSVNAQGCVSLIMKDGDAYRAAVYSGKGDLRSEGQFVDKRVTPVASAISEDGSVLAVCYLNTDGAEINSTINFFHINKSEAADAPDGFFAFSGDNPGRVIGAARFFGKTLVAVADDALLFYDPTDPNFAKREIPLSNKLTAISMDDGHVAVALGEKTAPDAPNPGLVQIYDDHLNLKGEFDAGANVSYLACCHGHVAVGAGRAFSVVAPDGKLLWIHEATADIRQAFVISSNEVALCGTTEIRTTKFK